MLSITITTIDITFPLFPPGNRVYKSLHHLSFSLFVSMLCSIGIQRFLLEIQHAGIGCSRPLKNLSKGPDVSADRRPFLVYRVIQVAHISTFGGDDDHHHRPAHRSKDRQCPNTYTMLYEKQNRFYRFLHAIFLFFSSAFPQLSM